MNESPVQLSFLYHLRCWLNFRRFLRDWHSQNRSCRRRLYDDDSQIASAIRFYLKVSRNWETFVQGFSTPPHLQSQIETAKRMLARCMETTDPEAIRHEVRCVCRLSRKGALSALDYAQGILRSRRWQHASAHQRDELQYAVERTAEFADISSLVLLSRFPAETTLKTTIQTIMATEILLYQLETVMSSPALAGESRSPSFIRRIMARSSGAEASTENASLGRKFLRRLSSS